MRSWLRFKAYHPGAKRAERWFKIHLVVYLIIVLLSSIIGYVRIQPLRAEFMAGEERTHCHVTDHGEFRSLDCHGYYDRVLAKRDAKLREMGCWHFLGNWHVGDDNEVSTFTVYFPDTLCWKPTFTL